MNIGENIRYYRKLAGMAQSVLAELVGEKQYAITKYEKGIHSPNPEQIQKIAEALNISVNLLFGEKPKEKIPALKKSSREGKLVEAFQKLTPAQQRVIVQQTEALAKGK